MNDPLSGPLLISDLLQHKALEPLDQVALATLTQIQDLPVEGYSEADVREEIISPVLKVLGYDKQSYFSIDREKAIALLGRNKFIDYNLTLWSENFWLIEAKKPKGRKKKFSYADISQAVGYAIHPEINAALVVLCDGWKIAIFDREVSQSDPVLTVDIQFLVRDIDKLRALLSPWQVWFFEKRRIVRQLDKVFDKEFNLGRMDEFSSLISRRLESKRSIIIDNLRRISADSTTSGDLSRMALAANPIDLVEGFFFLGHCGATTENIADTLVGFCDRSSFPSLYRVFPDHARDMNDHYCCHALNFLIHLHDRRQQVEWLPAWLGGGKELETAIQTYIVACLTQFSSDNARRNILLSASAFRRLYKASMVVDEGVWRTGDAMHVLIRFSVSEDSLIQILSSPERQNLLRLDGLVTSAVAQLVKDVDDGHEGPKPRLIEVHLRQLWAAEIEVLNKVPAYRELLEQRELGEIYPTEAHCVAYDNLGHEALCILDQHSMWKTYTLANHRTEVEMLASIGSWQARKWLGYEIDVQLQRPSDDFMADRFFLGDLSTYSRLKAAYGYA